MNTQSYIILLFFLITLFYICEPATINTRKSQMESKKKYRKKLSQHEDNHYRNTYSNNRRRMDDDEDDEEIDPTLKVYDRCDNGHTPDDISDCTKYETLESSCCIFTYGQDTGCVLIGFKYLGSKSVGDMTVTCHSYFIQTFNFLMIIIAFFIL